MKQEITMRHTEIATRSAPDMIMIHAGESVAKALEAARERLRVARAALSRLEDSERLRMQAALSDQRQIVDMLKHEVARLEAAVA